MKKRFRRLAQICLCCLLALAAQIFLPAPQSRDSAAPDARAGQTSPDRADSMIAARIPGAGSAWAATGSPLNICVVEDNFPFAQRGVDGKLEGFDIDLWQALRLPYSYVLITADFPTALARLEDKSCRMVLSNVSATPDRAKRFLLSVPYLQSGLSALLRADNTQIQHPQDLQGQTIAVLKGSIAEQHVMANFNKSVLLALPSEREAVAALQQDKAQAFVHDRPILQKILGRDGEMRLLEQDLAPQSYVYAFSRDEGTLLDVVNTALLKAQEQGVVGQLYVRWFGTPLPEQSEAQP